MFNTKNTCQFEGRISSDIDVSTIGQGTTAFTKAVFSIAVDKVLSATEKAKKAQESALPFDQKTVKTADFVQIQATGKTAEAIAQFFVKGKAIKVFCTYRPWMTVDKVTGLKKYGSGFDLEHFGFVTADSAAVTGATPGATAGAKPAYKAPYKAPVEDVTPIDEADIPF